MGSARSAETLWAICRDCLHFGKVPTAANARPSICSRCGSRSYDLTFNDPAEPRIEGHAEASRVGGALILLAPLPQIDIELARQTGRYP